MGARDQLRRAGAAARELEKRHFIGWRWAGDKVIRRAHYRRFQGMFARITAQQHHAHGAMLVDKGIQEIIARKQRVLPVGNQQSRFNLRGVGVQFAALMTEQGIDGRNAHL
ncbi:hypothetical protein D3C72_670240 [compost metagenome]